MVLDTSLLNTQHYKVRIKGKVEQSRERSGAFPDSSVLLANEKGAFGSPLSTVTYFTFSLYFIAFYLFFIYFFVSLLFDQIRPSNAPWFLSF